VPEQELKEVEKTAFDNPDHHLDRLLAPELEEKWIVTFIRDIKEAIDKLEKDKKISQDEQKRSLEELDKVSHAETKKIEDLSATKEKEIMGL